MRDDEEEDLGEVEAGAAGGGEADAEVNNVDGEEAAAEVIAEWVGPAEADAEVNIDEEVDAAEGVFTWALMGSILGILLD